jgi:putative pyruvate formate lyase activating enzyme
MTAGELALKLLKLQADGAHNINFVTPTPQAAAIFESLLTAYENGLTIPIVYNTSGYDGLRMIKLWDGIIDIYLPDIKYDCDETSKAVSRAECYSLHNRTVLKEMFRQVGLLQLDDDDIAVRGLIIRHLVLPGGLSGTRSALEFISSELSSFVAVSLMSQYFPAWKAHDHPILNRKLSREEYQTAAGYLEEFGMENGWLQPL